jgi:hypothetical protein
MIGGSTIAEVRNKGWGTQETSRTTVVLAPLAAPRPSSADHDQDGAGHKAGKRERTKIAAVALSESEEMLRDYLVGRAELEPATYGSKDRPFRPLRPDFLRSVGCRQIGATASRNRRSLRS